MLHQERIIKEIRDHPPVLSVSRTSKSAILKIKPDAWSPFSDYSVLKLQYPSWQTCDLANFLWFCYAYYAEINTKQTLCNRGKKHTTKEMGSGMISASVAIFPCRSNWIQIWEY